MREYKPVILFLAKFLGVYLIGNLIYGFWFESFAPFADPITYAVSGQTISFLDLFYDGLDYDYYPDQEMVWMALNNQVIINAFEGCNGLNVMILYLAFLVAYKGPIKDTIFYAIGGIIIIHLANVLRIAFLFVIAERYQSYLYFTHKYVFTGIIYAVIFLIWFFWIKRVNRLGKNNEQEPESPAKVSEV